MDSDLRKVIQALYVPLLLVLLIIIMHVLRLYDIIGFKYLALIPMEVEGLSGIVLMVFGHKDWDHLISNIIPLLLFAWALFYYYREFSLKALFLMWFIAGLWLWFFAQDGRHVGASGLVYALATFHITSAWLRRVFRLMAFAMLVIFLYGGMIWGFFPELFPEQNISWEGHLTGALAGITVAVYFRKRGLQKPVLEDDDEDEDEDEEIIRLWYEYQEGKKEDLNSE